LMLVVTLTALLAFTSVSVAASLRRGLEPFSVLPGDLAPAAAAVILLWAMQLFLLYRRVSADALIWPIVGLLIVLGLSMIFRLRGAEGAWQQVTRGLLPGVFFGAALILWPRLIELMRRWAVPISVVGLLLPIATALFGTPDETGARLALRIGPLPPIQTTEMIKVALLIFLAWFIEDEGQEAEGRAQTVLFLGRLPAPRYFLPGALFVGTATLALISMSDYGAVLILAFLFGGMLYAGFETRIFATIGAIGLAFALLVGFVLSFTWEVPSVVQQRIQAYRDPWSREELIVHGQPTGITIAEGPGYQIQQSIYAAVAGGVTGTGLGLGTPQFVPLASSDFIFAAVLEEMGSAIGIAILALFSLLVLRILRIGMLLPAEQVFERLLLVGIGIHLFTQVFVMVGGTLNLFPLTGVTVPFLSLGGSALMVNLVEIGIVLALMQRLEAQAA
jgi:cell division protein FtsW (lipid II flippase)